MWTCNVELRRFRRFQANRFASKTAGGYFLMHIDQRSSSVSRRHFLAASAAFGLSGAGSVSSAAAQDPSSAKEFRQLFNGVDLTGWHPNRGRSVHGRGGRWLVEDGVLTGQQDPPGSGNGGLLLSDEQFGDFELLIDMRPDWGPDSGVFFRCTERGAGFQMYVDYHDNGNVGHLRGEMPGAFALKPFQIFGQLDDRGQLTGFTTRPDPRTRNWPEGVYEYVCDPQEWLSAWRIDQWNTARIRCVGKYPKITTWINDVKLCHFDSETSTFPGHDKQRVFQQLGREGSIGLQVHGGKGWPQGAKCRWRDIRIKPL